MKNATVEVSVVFTAGLLSGLIAKKRLDTKHARVGRRVKAVAPSGASYRVTAVHWDTAG